VLYSTVITTSTVLYCTALYCSVVYNDEEDYAALYCAFYACLLYMRVYCTVYVYMHVYCTYCTCMSAALFMSMSCMSMCVVSCIIMCTVQYCTVQYCTVCVRLRLCRTALYNTVLYVLTVYCMCMSKNVYCTVCACAFACASACVQPQRLMTCRIQPKRNPEQALPRASKTSNTMTFRNRYCSCTDMFRTKLWIDTVTPEPAEPRTH